MNREQQRAELHRTIWKIANDLRGAVDGWDFKQYVLGFLFYRFVSENITNYLNKKVHAADDSSFDYAQLSDAQAENARQSTTEEKGFYILPSELFENVRTKAKIDANLNETLERVFKNIEGSAIGFDSENDLKGLFDDLDLNSNKLGATVPKRNELLVKLIDAIGDMDLGNFQDNNIDAFGDAYEYLMQMYASNAGKSGGEFYTPQEVAELLAKITLVASTGSATAGVEPVETTGIKYKTEINKVYDPCCGSGGFLLAAKDFLKKDVAAATEKQKEALANSTFYGIEIVPNTFRLCLMNMLLHGIGEFGSDNLPIECKDSLASEPSRQYDFVMTNPPFGTKSSLTIEVEEKDKETGETITKTKKQSENYTRNDFITTTSNKQLNFLQHIKSLLKTNGTAAVVLPDNVLFEDGAGKIIRQDLLKTCDLHTILRLPTGIFYAQGVKANVLFFEKKETSKITQTKDVWVYDYRTNVKHTLKTNPLKESDLDDFVKCYNPENRHKRTETYSEDNPDGRWRKYSVEEIFARDKTSLDITWLKSGEETIDYSLAELMTMMEEKSANIASAMEKLKKIIGGIENE